jgi:hypothetical protein
MHFASFVCAILLTVLLTTTCFAQESHTMLQGGIELYANTEEIPPELFPGKLFSQKLAESLLQGKVEISFDKWRIIHHWLGGRWKTSKATNTRRVKIIDGKPVDIKTLGLYTMKSIEDWGSVKDKNGAVWEKYDSNYWAPVDYGDSINYSYIILSGPGKGEYPDLYTKCIDFIVDKKTNIITSVQQRKAWDKHTLLAPGKVQDDIVQTEYDENGKHTLTSWNTSIMKQEQDFDRLNNGRDESDRIKDFYDLKNFLSQYGKQDLLPSCFEP